MNINIQEIAKSITKFLVEKAIYKLDTENIQKVIQFGVGKLKELAAGTTTTLDDWAIGEIENYLNDTAKVEQIRAFIISRLNKLCADIPNATEFESLADSLAVCHDGCCGTPAGNKLIAEILEGITTPIIKHFTEKED